MGTLKSGKIGWLSLVTGAALALALALVAAPAASADTVVGWGMPTIVVNTGAKNYSNHTQWVSSIYVETPGHCDGGQVEAWTAGWYASTPQVCGAVFYYINRWVPSGNGVCARAWVLVQQPWPWHGWHWVYGVTCISIKV